jgi:RNA-binding motif protein, X-linked 2
LEKVHHGILFSNSTQLIDDRHDDFQDSAYIYIGGLPYELTEGDVICVFSQYGEVLDINMVRDRETGKQKGFCFLKYDDQRSTVLAVDNFNGATLLGRTLRVDHSRDYRQKKRKRRKSNESQSEESEEELDDEGKPRVKGFNVAPKGWLDPPVEESESEKEDLGEGIDLDDPMRDYLIEKRREEKQNQKVKNEDDERKKKHRHRSRKDGEERHRHRHRKDRYIEDRKRDGDERRDGSRRRRQKDNTPKINQRGGTPVRARGQDTPQGSTRTDDTPERAHGQDTRQRFTRRDDTPEKSRRDREHTPDHSPHKDRKEQRFDDKTR